MEKLKHVIHPGKEHDDEILYGSGRTSDPVHAGDTVGGHHVDPLAGNVNKPLPHTPASFTGAPGTGSTAGVLPQSTVGSTTTATTGTHHSHGTHGAVPVGEVRHHYHMEHELHPKNPPPLADPRIGDAIVFGHTPVETLRAAIETPVPTIIDTVPVVGSSPVVGHGHTTSPTSGPHKSSLMNKMDPRVDSDNDGSRPLGGHVPGAQSSGPTHTSGTIPVGAGYGSPTTAGGPHTTNLANRLDPRVDSDRDGSALVGTSGIHHPGRDAAVLGGAAATGTAGYSASGHPSDPLASSTTAPYSGTSGAPVYGTTEAHHAYTEDKHQHHTDKHHHDEKQRNTGFLDLLHRNKDTHHDDVGNQQPYSSTGTTGTTGVTGDQSTYPYSSTGTTGGTYDDDHHERHRLHKDPPKELLEQKGIPSSDPYGTRTGTGGY